MPLRFAILTILIALPAAARADRFMLASGGAVEGTLLNRDQTPRSSYEIRTAAGMKLVLAAEQVAAVVRQKEREAEYAQVAPAYEDTVARQWELAEWCRQHQLSEQRAIHLRRIIELEPDHIKARHALGYVQLDGKWSTQSETLAGKGYKLYRGQWRTPQDIALIEQRENSKQVAKDWLNKLKRWRADLNDPKVAAAAYQHIAGIRDAAAVGPLLEMLKADSSFEAKSLYVEVLEKIASAEAVEALVWITLNDGDVEMFHNSAEALERLKPPRLSKPYLDALKNDNNVRLNRAANMLARLGDASAIAPLIEVLVTTHTVTVGGGGSQDSISTSFGGNGNSFQTGSAPQKFAETVQNREVLDALTRLSGGQSFGYNVAAWRRWHAAERSRAKPVELR
jgi:hypothetical protein